VLAAYLCASALVLTSCASPMPPEVKALQSENVITCVDGAVQISAPKFFSDQLNTWVTDFTAACPNTTVTVVPTGDAQATAVIDIAGATQACKTEIQSPIAFDAAVPVVNFSDGTIINLSPKTLANVLNGKITSWTDASIAAENDGVTLPEEPITVSPTFFQPAAHALDSWMTRLDSANWKLNSNLAFENDFDVQAPDPTLSNEGNFSVIPYSLATSIGLSPIGIIASANSDPIIPGPDSIYAGATQVEAPVTDSKISEAKLNPTTSPSAQPGSDQIAVPWQGIYTIQASTCSGPSEQASRAFVRFILRSQEQATLTDSNYLPLMDQIRFGAIGALQAGLPEVTATPSTSNGSNSTNQSATPQPMQTDTGAPMSTDGATPEPTQ